MSRVFAALTALLALLLAPAAQAQTAQHADPALWVVKDEDTTIYLFGTIHALKPGLSWFDAAVKDAFDKSGELVVEMVTPDPAEAQGILLPLAINQTGPSLTDKLPADKRPALARAVADLGLPGPVVDRFDPWYAAVALTVTGLPKFGYDPESGADRTLQAAAQAAGKPVKGLETFTQQLGYFDTMPEPLQLRFLESTLDELPQLGAELDKMVETWAKGDPDALAATMNESVEKDPEVARILLTDRNARWAEWIEARLKQPGTVFVAVGAGHLAGPDSVQAQLARHKLKAERIVY